MVDEYASLLHHFLKMEIAQWIRRVPTDAQQNDVDWESHSFGAQHRVSTLFSQRPQHSRAGCLTVNATKPTVANQVAGSVSVVWRCTDVDQRCRTGDGVQRCHSQRLDGRHTRRRIGFTDRRTRGPYLSLIHI